MKGTTMAVAQVLKKDDELALAFLDSDPRKPRTMSRNIAKQVKIKKAAAKPDNDFKLLCGIIRRHSVGLWSLIAVAEFVIIIWVKLGK